LNRLLEVIARLLPCRDVDAHCDIPCGIYDPHTAQLAALTVIRMDQLIAALPAPGPQMAPEDGQTYVHKLGRYTEAKDQHAEACKRELRVLWADYFTPDHLQKHPQLHGLFWEAMKLASKARQEVNLQAAQDLLGKVQSIAEIFWNTKGFDTRRQPSGHAVGGDLVYPQPK